MDRAKWDAIVREQMEAYNEYIAAGPDAFARVSWEFPQCVYGGDKAYDRTRTPYYTKPVFDCAAPLSFLKDIEDALANVG